MGTIRGINEVLQPRWYKQLWPAGEGPKAAFARHARDGSLVSPTEAKVWAFWLLLRAYLDGIICDQTSWLLEVEYMQGFSSNVDVRVFVDQPQGGGTYNTQLKGIPEIKEECWVAFVNHVNRSTTDFSPSIKALGDRHHCNMPPKASKRDRIRNKIRSTLGRTGDTQNRPLTSQIAPDGGPSVLSTSGTLPPKVGALNATSTKGDPSQAENSTTTTTLTPATNPTTTPSADSDNPKQAGNTARQGLETTLRVLLKSADALPLLKSAVTEFVSCLDTVQLAADNRDDYEAITTELTTMGNTINKHMGDFKSEYISDAITNITLAINREIEHIKARQSRTKLKQMLESTKDRDDVMRCYRRVEGLFRQLQYNTSLERLHISDSGTLSLLDYLEGMEPAKDARYNSSFSTIIQRGGCTAETREKIHEDLQNWVQDPNSPKIYWMNGMAGTGKTTIAYSLCEWLEEHKQLGASFFCSRASPSCRNANRIIPTIAFFLACYSSIFRGALWYDLISAREAAGLNIALQFKRLLQKPMQRAEESLPEGLVIVIDALDECDNNSEVRLLLETLLEFGANLPLKFFVASRPEYVIRDKMVSRDGYPLYVLHLHDIEESSVEGDIKKYLKQALNLMPQPPSQDQIDVLARQAGRLFIYAATVARYILPEGIAVNSNSRLKTMLAVQAQSTVIKGSNKKYKEIDRLYTTILAAAFDNEALEDEELEAIRLVLETVVCAKGPLTVPAIASILYLEEEQVLSSLQPLRSVLHISEDAGIVSTLHASFPDYLRDQSRSSIYYTDEGRIHTLLASRSFEIMKQLRFNICGLETSLVYDKEVPNLEARVKDSVSVALLYACRFWGEHLQRAGTSGSFLSQLVDFLSFRLLFWMEALNLSRCIGDGPSSLLQAQKWLLANNGPEDARRQLADAWSFVTRFSASPCTLSTPHLYISALPFCPKSSSVYTHYWGRTRGLMDVRGAAITYRADAPLATWLTDSVAEAIAISHDGTKLAIGSDDYTIRICDSQNGITLAGPFKGHKGAVRAISFSPNSTKVLSGSSDCTVHVWDICGAAGTPHSLQGHMNPVISVAFSSDGTRIISGDTGGAIRMWNATTSAILTPPVVQYPEPITCLAFSADDALIATGSSDCMIRVLDVHTGATVAGPFGGHTGPITSIALFFNGKDTHIVSGSEDQTIRNWSMASGSALGAPFRGHNETITSVSVFPDGTRIMSGSRDRTIRVWDKNMTERVPKNRSWMLDRHSLQVECVAFSSDDSKIASGSHDRTVRVWDKGTGELVAGPFQGHTDSITSVVFSPDGGRLAAGSIDQTVCIWDYQTADLVIEPLRGHVGPVNCVVFSYDGDRVASGSCDCTIRVWKAETGKTVIEPLQGHVQSVTSIMFSPDGSQLVSGSADTTIRVWDVYSGDTIVELLESHTGCVSRVAFSPDGTRIASGGYDKAVRLWDARTGSAIAEIIQGHSQPVILVGFSQDGDQVISGSRNSSIGVWDLRTGSVSVPLFQADVKHISSIAFSPRSSLVVSSTNGMYLFKSHMFPTIRTTSLDQHSVTKGPLGRRWGFMGNGWIISTDGGDLDNPYWSPRRYRSHPRHDILLFWIPPELHDSLPLPQNDLAIGPLGCLQIDYSTLMYGDNWSNCYRSDA